MTRHVDLATMAAVEQLYRDAGWPPEDPDGGHQTTLVRFGGGKPTEKVVHNVSIPLTKLCPTGRSDEPRPGERS